MKLPKPQNKSVILSSGVYFIRGYFLNVNDQVLILDPHSNNPSYRVGFNVIVMLSAS